MRRVEVLVALVAILSCNGTTGFSLVQFYVAGHGFADAVKGRPYTFDAPAGLRVTLTKASLHVGALYLTQAVPQAGGGPEPCILPQTYAGAFVGEVRGDGDVDLLDPSIQQLSVVGDGSTIPAIGGQVWLTHDNSIMRGNVNGSDALPILTLQGHFEDRSGSTSTFSAGITIDLDRISGAANTGLPGETQICQQRIVSGIPANITLVQAGTLVLAIDAQALLIGVPFGDLPTAVSLANSRASACSDGGSTDRCFTNDDSNISSRTLFANLKTTGPYGFAWLAPAP
jgi:hypothetical protein